MYTGNLKTPIYIDYYFHEECDCYKIDIPWSQYNKHTLVLCPVSDGIEKARELAIEELTKYLLAVIPLEIVDE